MTRVPSFRVFERLYRFFSTRRKTLFAATAILIALGSGALLRLELREDVESMLPDDGSGAARDFRLLQSAPFTRKIVITLTGGPQTGTAELLAAADRLSAALVSPDIPRVVSGPGIPAGGDFMSRLVRSLPALVTPSDMTTLGEWCDGQHVRDRLRESYEKLLSPEGWAAKGAIRSDPLSFRQLATDKMRFLNMIPGMRVQGDHFVSADGKSTLLIADTTVPITDAQGGARLLGHVSERIAAAVPPGIGSSVVSGHRYTLANAMAVQRDLYVILGLASIAVLAIYVFYLRSLSAVFVFLVPGTALIVASGAIALLAKDVFAVTIGFGGVLLGIADEYAMHVYFSCRKGDRDIAAVIGEISRPVLFGGMATLASFAVMLTSNLPGQRQLAVYTMIGIVTSLAISLVVLPHVIRPPRLQPPPSTAPGGLSLPFTLPPRRVAAAWLLLLAVFLWQATKIRFNGDMRAVGLVPQELREAERNLSETWGDVRAKAVLFAEGKDLESALEANDRLFRLLSGKIPDGEMVSLAPVLPSRKTQTASIERWTGFWKGGRADRLAGALRREGEPMGFAGGAFAPFLEGLRRTPDYRTVDDLRSAGMGDLVDSLIRRTPGSVQVMTLVPDTPERIAMVQKEVARLPDVHLVAQSLFGDGIGKVLRKNFTSYLLMTSLLVLALVVSALRRPKKILLALVPVVTGLAAMLGIMGMLGVEFNLFNIMATILIIGLCVDYGIFMVCKLTEGADHAADRAVLVSGLTTLAGFGSLVFARHPAMHSIGLTVLLGIGFGIASALLVVPALHGGTNR